MASQLLSLPDELLLQVFRELQYSWFEYQKHYLARLSLVCRRFSVLLRQPSELWASLALDTEPWPPDTGDSAEYRTSVALFILPRQPSISRLHISATRRLDTSLLMLCLLPGLRTLHVLLPGSSQSKEVLAGAIGRNCKGLSYLDLYREHLFEDGETCDWEPYASLQPITALAALKHLKLDVTLVLESPGLLLAPLVCLNSLACLLPLGEELLSLTNLIRLRQLDIWLEQETVLADEDLRSFSEAVLHLPALQGLSVHGLGSAAKLAFCPGSQISRVHLVGMNNLVDSFEAVSGLTSLKDLAVDCHQGVSDQSGLGGLVCGPARHTLQALMIGSEGCIVAPDLVQLTSLTSLHICSARMLEFPYFLQSLPWLEAVFVRRIFCRELRLDLVRVAAFPALRHLDMTCCKGGVLQLEGCSEGSAVECTSLILHISQR